MSKKNFSSRENDILVIAKGAGIVFSGTLIGSGLRYVFQIMAARNLGPELFGLFTLGFAAYKIAGMIAELGLPNGLLRFIPIFHGENDPARTKGVITDSRNLGFFASIVISASLFLFSGPMATSVFHAPELAPVMRLFAAAIPFATLTTLFLFGTQGFKIMKYKILVREIFEPSVRIILVLILSLLTWKLYGIVLAYIIPILLATAISSSYLKKVFPDVAKKSVATIRETRKLLNFSLPLLFVQFFGLVVLWTDTLMLGYFRTAEEVGIYGAAQRTALLGSLISTSFGSIFAPIISGLFNRKEFDKLRSYFQTVAKWIFSFSFPLLLAVILLSEHILGIFGHEFRVGSGSLILLSLAWIVHSAVGSAGQMIIMTGRQKLHLLNMIFVVIVNIVLNIVFIPSYGMKGAALATFTSIALFNIMELLQVRLILKIQPYRADFLKPVLAGTLSAAILFLLTESIFNGYNPLSIAVLCFVFFSTYTVFIVILGLQEEDKTVLSRIKEAISAAARPGKNREGDNLDKTGKK
ncbi:MAG: flippase [Candidatus Aminicenantes bacterium]|nr:flippase [Candidatus Aminicenantes bacterium]